MGEVFSVKLNPEQAKRADEVRGGQSRSAWLRALIEPVINGPSLGNGHSALPGVDLQQGDRPAAPCPLCPVLQRQVDSLRAQVEAAELGSRVKVLVPLDPDEDALLEDELPESARPAEDSRNG